LEWQKLIQGSNTLIAVTSEDHLTHEVDTITFEEHEIRTAKTNPFGTESDSLLSLQRCIRIGADAHCTELIRPAHNSVKKLEGVAVLSIHIAIEHLGYFGRSSCHVTGKDFACSTVD